MPGASVQLLGAKELIDEFQRLNEAVATEYIDESLEAGAETILAAIDRVAPEKSGVLKNSISLRTTQVSRTRVEKVIEISSRAFYWRYLEFGTRFIQAREFIRKSFRNRKGTARNTIRDTFRDRVMGFKD
jgi:HK97 gp10 family phage protein